MNNLIGYIHILPKHASALERALRRAEVAGINSDPDLHYTTPHQGDSLDTLMISSSTEPGYRYDVHVRVIGHEVYTKCACRAGSTGSICQHIALALDIMGFTQPLIIAPLLTSEQAVAA